MSRCASKRVYYSKSQARAAAKRLGHYWYECEQCRNFHTTKQNPKLFKRRQHAQQVWARSRSLRQLGYDK